MPPADDKYRRELQNEVKLVLDMTARVDERVKLIVEKQTEMTARLNGFIDSHNALAGRVMVLEAGSGDIDRFNGLFERVVKLEADPTADNIERVEKMVAEFRAYLDEIRRDAVGVEKRVHMLEDASDGMWTKTRYIIDLIVKAVWALAIGYLLYKTGWSAPTTPH